jgi:hypothetical protein
VPIKAKARRGRTSRRSLVVTTSVAGRVARRPPHPSPTALLIVAPLPGTRATRDTSLTLHTFRGAGSQCWPSHVTLADRAKCCNRTVQRALQQAQHIGLVSWAECHVRTGRRWLRTSNIYWFLAPDTPVQSGVRIRPVFRHLATTGQNVEGGEKSKKERDKRLSTATPDRITGSTAWRTRSAWTDRSSTAWTVLHLAPAVGDDGTSACGHERRTGSA